MSVKNNYAIPFAVLSDWLKKYRPAFTTNERTSYTVFFRALVNLQVICYSSNSDCYIALFAAITLVLDS